MPFSWDNFPYTNFHELNLDWFIKKFKEIFDEWESLYQQMINWRDNTDRDLALWKNEVLDSMEQWQTDLLDALDEWKSATGEDIGEWETGVISDLNDWKDDFLEAYNALAESVEAIVSDTVDMVENLAEPFSSSKNYVAGDYVVENGVLYRFTSNHNAGAWTGSDATQQIAMNDINNLRTSFDENINEIILNWNDGGYIDRDTGAIVTYTGWKYSDEFEIDNLDNGYFLAQILEQDTQGSSFNVFYDASHTKIDSYFGISSFIRTIPIPKGAKYARISIKNTENAVVFNDRIASKIKWYKYTNTVLCTDIFNISKPKYRINIGEGFTVSVIEYAEDGTLLNQTNYLGSRDYYRGYNVYKIELRVKAESGYTLTANSEVIKNITIEPKEQYDKIEYLKIMTLNAGRWYNGVSRMPDAQVATNSVLYHRMLGKENCDIVCLQEAPDKINVSETVGYSTLFSNKYPYRNSYSDGNTGLKVVSKNAILNPETLEFTSNSERPFACFEYNIADVIIKVFIVHLSTEANTTGIRQQDLAELATLLGQCDYGIVLGDFNTYDMSEITSAFTGFNICNGTIFGAFETWTPTGSWTNGAIDNIITTSNISIENVYMESESLSDHKGLIAELNLYY